VDGSDRATDKGASEARRTLSGAVLPTVIATSVIRSAHKGQSHGGVYLVDLESGSIQQKVDWDDPGIDWEGRGGDRGLRGIAFFEDLMFLAASDEVFIFDRDFKRVGSITSPYLRHCHEIAIDADRRLLAMTSTGFDSVLLYDLNIEKFVKSVCIRFGPLWRHRQRLWLRPLARLVDFDPTGPSGPEPGDSCHINMVSLSHESMFVCGTKLGTLWEIRGTKLARFGKVPYGTHNAQPWQGGVVANDTEGNRVGWFDRSGRVRGQSALPSVDMSILENVALPKDHARPSFGRGLKVIGERTVVAGSSPATITVHDLEQSRIIKSMNLTMDLRNAVHGLEIWPFSA
jgi:hypothetical protein